MSEARDIHCGGLVSNCAGQVHTVEPLKRGHYGDRHFVLSRERLSSFRGSCFRACMQQSEFVDLSEATLTEVKYFETGLLTTRPLHSSAARPAHMEDGLDAPMVSCQEMYWFCHVEMGSLVGAGCQQLMFSGGVRRSASVPLTKCLSQSCHMC